MTTLWDVDGPNLDLGYVSLREGRTATEQALREALDAKWGVYEPYADPEFREGFARDPHARFWEMYIGEALLQAGMTLLTSADRERRGGQPDICALDGERRVWIEAIAPDVGDVGPDQVRGPTPINEGGGVAFAPTRQAQLRITSALWTKSQVIQRYLREGVIAPRDVRLIAIGAGRFGLYASEDPLPLILSAVFPIGEAFVTLETESGETIDQGFRPSFEIGRRGGSISRTAFLDPQFAHVSGIVWSRAGIGNWSRTQRPLTLVHNPLATVPLTTRWSAWDREFVAVENAEGWVATDILAAESD